MTAHDASGLPSGGRRLRALFIGGYDSANYAHVELVREFAARGHSCTVVVENDKDVVNNKMFTSAGIPTTLLSRFSPADLDGVDCVFSGPFLRRQHKPLLRAIYERDTFLYSFANLFSSVTMRIAPDLVITSSQSRFEEFERNGLRYNAVAVGNPQYDPLLVARTQRERVKVESIRRVLVVDQGAYPFGETGKRQLAQTLVAMARNNPELSFAIKPRYVPNEEGEHLHSVSDHLYSYLGETPGNLTLISRPTILEELILDYDAMITTWSTAHLDAVALDLPLLLIGGLDSQDVFDVRRQRVEAAYAHLQETGCVVDWRELQSGPPPFSHVSADYANVEFYDTSVPCAPRIVDMVERIDAVLVSKGRVLCGNVQLPYSAFMDRIEQLPSCETTSTECRVGRALYRETNAAVQSLVFDNRCMGFALDMNRVLGFWNRSVEDRSVGDVRGMVAEVRDAGARLKGEYFEAHPEEVGRDPFIQDAYFDWLLEMRRYRELHSYDGRVVAPESLAFDRGMACLRRGRVLRAARHFVDSFDRSLLKQSRELKKNKDIKVLLSRTDQYLLAHVILVVLAVYGRREALAGLDIPGRPDLDALVFYRMRALIALGRIPEAVAVHVEYSAAIEGKSAAAPRGGLEDRLLQLTIRVYRRRLRRLARTLSARTSARDRG